MDDGVDGLNLDHPVRPFQVDCAVNGGGLTSAGLLDRGFLLGAPRHRRAAPTWVRSAASTNSFLVVAQGVEAVVPCDEGLLLASSGFRGMTFGVGSARSRRSSSTISPERLRSTRIPCSTPARPGASETATSSRRPWTSISSCAAPSSDPRYQPYRSWSASMPPCWRAYANSDGVVVEQQRLRRDLQRLLGPSSGGPAVARRVVRLVRRRVAPTRSACLDPLFAKEATFQ